MKTVIAIPTRNRPGLARAAIRAVLSQPCGDALRLLVSDNSTEPAARAELARSCRRVADARLAYFRPSRPLSVAEHFEWLMQHVLAVPQASHFLFVTDRTVFRRRALREVLERVAAHPEVPLSFAWDYLLDHKRPVELLEKPWSGRVLPVEPSHVVKLFSLSVFPCCTPLLVNSVVPRRIVEAVRARFGNVFGEGVSPDNCFGFRCLEVLDAPYRYYDASCVINYGQRVSVSASIARGVPNPAARSWRQSGADLFAAPVPGFRVIVNVVLHEYNRVKQATNSPRFVAIDPARYLEAVAAQVGEIEDAALRQEMEVLLAAHGWRQRRQDQPPALVSPPGCRFVQALRHPVRSARSWLSWCFGLPLLPEAPTTTCPELTTHRFRNATAALRFANRPLRTRLTHTDHLDYLRPDWQPRA
jgi:hypothetical protein